MTVRVGGPYLQITHTLLSYSIHLTVNGHLHRQLQAQFPCISVFQCHTLKIMKMASCKYCRIYSQGRSTGCIRPLNCSQNWNKFSFWFTSQSIDTKHYSTICPHVFWTQYHSPPIKCYLIDLMNEGHLMYKYFHCLRYQMQSPVTFSWFFSSHLIFPLPIFHSTNISLSHSGSRHQIKIRFLNHVHN
jgi:hypothetical protein